MSTFRTPKPSGLTPSTPSSRHTMSPRRSTSTSHSLSTLSVSQISQLKEAFTLLDRDGDGIISPSDLTSMLSSLGLDSSPSAVSQFFRAAGSSDSQPFNLASYLTHLSQQLSLLSPPEELLSAFEAFDEFDDGTVDLRELKMAVMSRGGGIGGMTDEEVEEAVKGFKRRRGLRKEGGGGEIFQYREFVGALAGKEAGGMGSAGEAGN